MMRTLVALLGAALAWTVHFNVSYALVALACGSVVSAPGVWLMVVTLVCGTAAIVSGGIAVRDWRAARGNVHERRRVLLCVGGLAAVLFTVAIIFEALVPMFLPYCPTTG